MQNQIHLKLLSESKKLFDISLVKRKTILKSADNNVEAAPANNQKNHRL